MLSLANWLRGAGISIYKHIREENTTEGEKLFELNFPGISTSLEITKVSNHQSSEFLATSSLGVIGA